MHSLDEQNQFAYNLFVKHSGRGWSDFNFKAQVARLSFCQAISSTGWARMLWCKVLRGANQGEWHLLFGFFRMFLMPSFFCLWFILGKIPCSAAGSVTAWHSAVDKCFEKGPRGVNRGNPNSSYFWIVWQCVFIEYAQQPQMIGINILIVLNMKPRSWEMSVIS